VERAESYYAKAVAYGDAAVVKEAQADLEDAKNAFASFDSERKARIARLRALQNDTESALLERCERFLSAYPRALFMEVSVAIPAGDLSKHLTKKRDAISNKKCEIENIDLAPVTPDEAIAIVDRDIEKFARDGAPDLYGPTRFEGTHSYTRRQGVTRWPEIWTGTGGHRLRDGFALIFWAFKEVIRERLVAEVRERIARSKFAPIAIADREPLRQKMETELLQLEREEEAIISALQDAGDKNAVRRFNADPRAVLGIEIIEGTITETQSPRSLAEYIAEPKMKTPADQTLPRQSQWLNTGPRNADAGADD
jgi:hypothetical protein